MLKLTDSIKTIAGISDKRAALYKKLHIETIGELLSHYPRDYIDLSAPVLIADAVLAASKLGELGGENAGEFHTIHATVSRKLPPFLNARLPIYKLKLTDSSGELTCTFFNAEYSYNRLITGNDYVFYGKVTVNQYGAEIVSPVFILPQDPNRLTAKYRATAGLTHNIISANIKNALEVLENAQNDIADETFADLPAKIRENHGLLSASEAVRTIHFPNSREQLDSAKRSLIFKELFTLQIGMSLIRSRNRKLTGAQMSGKFSFGASSFATSLPFTPTNAQIRAVDDCVRDMRKAVPMNRLLQGDVGSGKTLVAAAAAFYAHENGFQTAIMVPTEILAKQHYKTLCDFLAPHGIGVELIVGAMKVAEKKERWTKIKSGEVSVAVGTHALIQKGSDFANLGLVVTDEQHRFGVNQRSELISKGANPHTLVMSATPIPRTLGLIIYGDLDISLLDEMPKGRLPIKTYGVDTTYRKRLYEFIRKEIASGRQAYIVCPLISESADTDITAPSKASAVKYYETLTQSWFCDIPTGLLHGRMKQAEKDEVMGAFKSGELKILVSTTVIEVGVDVPNATVMMIENVEQFGLSQLHQLRGRVGRGEHQSHCILVSDSKSTYTRERVETMVATCDGFEIAGKDLELRGPGDFFGQKQHGLPLLKIGDLATDTAILDETRELSRTILEQDPTLATYPELRALADALFKESNEYGFN